MSTVDQILRSLTLLCCILQDMKKFALDVLDLMPVAFSHELYVRSAYHSVTVRTTLWNKKVVLREHKRHTARCVASPWGGTYLGWRGEGVPTLARGRGYLPWPGGSGYLPWPGEGVPTLAGGRGNYLSWGEGVPTLVRGRGTYLGLGEGVLTLAGGRGYPPWWGGTYLGWGEGGTHLGWGEGVPTLAGGVPTLAGMGYPPCEPTKWNYYLPHPSVVTGISQP